MKIWCAVVCAMFATVCFAEYRTWTNSEGKRMTAEFVRFEGTNVVLKRKKNGAIRKVNLKQFSAADRAYLKHRPGYPAGSVAETWDNPKQKASISDRLADVPQWVLGAIIVAALVVNIPVILLIGRGLFGDMNGFMEAIRFWFQPDWISCWRGEWGADWIAEFKLGLFMVLCVGLFIIEGFLVLNFIA